MPEINSKLAGAVADEKSAGRVQVLDPLAVPNWDALVGPMAGSTFFHGSAWARTLESSYGYKPVYFARVDGERLTMLFPMMEVRSWLTGKRGVSLPFTDACEPLGNVEAETLEEIGRFGLERGWKYWEQRGGNVPAATLSEAYFAHVLNLTPGENQVFESFDSSTRRAIRKGEKGNLQVEQSRSLDEMRVFYELHCKTRKKHGVPPQPFSFFANFHRNVLAQNHGFVMLAHWEGKPIAANVFVHAGTKAIYKYGASDEAYQELRGSNLVMWRAIQWYIRAGFEEVDFGRTGLASEGLRRFKLGWGATEREIRYCRYDFQKRKYVTGRAEAEGWSNRVVRALPIPVARLAGGLLYRHVA